jgi:ubiquinone/menaquinone biosynthesis C-methylase UbiE
MDRTGKIADNTEMTDNPDTRSRFDRQAPEWDANPARVALARAVADEIRKAVPFRPGMAALDFGAGTGLVSLALLPDLASITAVDTSADMLRVLNDKLKANGISNVRTLLTDGAAPLPQAGFDLVVSSMVLHHLPDVPAAIGQMRDALRPGGWIALADLETEDGSFHSDPSGVFHHGLDPAAVLEWLRQAGFTDCSTRRAYRLIKPTASGGSRQYAIFLATGTGERRS